MLNTPVPMCFWKDFFFGFYTYTRTSWNVWCYRSNITNTCVRITWYFFFFFLTIYNDELLKERRWLAVVRRCVVMMIDVGVCLIRGGVQDRRAGQRKHKKQEKKENWTISELGSGGYSELIFYVKLWTFDRFVTRKRFRRRIIYSKKRDRLRCIYSVYFFM